MRPLPPLLEVKLSQHDLWVKSSGVEGTQLYVEDEDLSWMDFSERDLSGGWIPAVSFDNCRLIKTDLYRANLASSTFRNADMTNCCLVKADLMYASLQDAVLAHSNMIRVECCYTNLSKADLSGSDLRGAWFYAANLSDAILTNANVGRCSLDNADLTNANLKNLQGVEELFIESIIVNGEVLIGEDARMWIAEQSST